MPHLAADLPVQLAHAVGRARRLEREHGHAKFLVVVVRIHPAKREQLLGADVELPVQVPHRVIHQLMAKTIVTGRHRRVSREQALPPCPDQRLVKTGTPGDLLAHQLQGKKRCVALVHVKHRRLHAEPPQQPHPTHAKQDFLHDARRVVAAVHAPREVAKVRLVRRQIGVDQINRAAADINHPGAKRHRLGGDLHRANQRLAVVVQHRLKRKILRVKLAVILRLPVLGTDRLLKIALAVKQADADKAKAKVAGRLGVVAGQHAQAAGCDRQRLVKAKLRAEIRHRPPGQAGRMLRRPSAGRAQIGVELPEHLLHAAVELLAKQPHPQFLVRQLPQHRHGVVIKVTPRARRQFLEHILRILVPRPPQVASQPVQAGDGGVNLIQRVHS